MKRTIINLCACVLFISLTSAVHAQISTPSASPSCKMEQKVGLTDVTLEYSRPSMKDRTIFAADGLVPFGKPWRLGANSATKITFSDDVTLEGNALAAGSYAILSVPGAEKWEIHFHEHSSTRWSTYMDKEPALKIEVKPLKISATIETMFFMIGQISTDGAVLQLFWESTMVPMKLGVEVDKRVMADIEKTLAGPSAGEYYAAGSYYHKTGKDLEMALNYVQKATHVDEPRYWQVRTEAMILADLGRTKDAINAAQKSLDLAKEAGDDNYVSMNEKSIMAWKMDK